MRLVWTIKVYDTGGFKDRFRVKISGVPYGYSQPWVNGAGKGDNQNSAYQRALDSIKSGTKPEIESIPAA